ncbi:MAG: prepilin peptidase [Oligoflexia bacterium]|nr:prepilin peptidase [Oligoflexia bacterium]
MDVVKFIIASYCFALGACLGSFANVLIYRLPENKSVAVPRSMCRSCGRKIPFYENIPIVSYLFLRGKCRGCGVKISYQYILVELLVGMAAIFFAPKLLTIYALFMFLFNILVATAFIALFVIDIRHYILPDEINISLGVLFLIFALVHHSFAFWGLGGAIGFAFPSLITYLFYVIKGQDGLGGGDIKLFGILGLYLGPIMIIQNIFLSCLLGSILGVAFLSIGRIRRETPIPFGPFIIVVASMQIFFPETHAKLMNFLWNILDM